MLELNSTAFGQTIAAEPLVIVDFWAEWCAPCRMFAPIFQQLANEMEGQAVFAKVDVDKESRLAEELAVSSIPTLILFKNGQQVERIVGVRSKDAVAAVIAKYR
jgi:thioredoxin